MFKRLLLALLVVFMALPAQAALPAKPSGDYVVLLHGIFLTKSRMEELAEAFTGKGYQVLNIDYKSTDLTIAENATDISKQISAFATDRSKKIHFVGHSMGGLVTRVYLAKYKPKNVGRVVMLGTPNGGSEVADFLKTACPLKCIYRSLYGPAGQELSTDKNFNKTFGAVRYDVGVIAGNASIDPVSSLIIPGDDDGKVSIENTRVKGQKDHIVLSATHTFMPTNDNVVAQAVAFVENGKFKR